MRHVHVPYDRSKRRFGERLVVACGEGAVELVTLQQPGRQRMEAAAFLNGYPLDPGDTLGS